jgi:hypothetical protein
MWQLNLVETIEESHANLAKTFQTDRATADLYYSEMIRCCCTPAQSTWVLVSLWRYSEAVYNRYYAVSSISKLWRSQTETSSKPDKSDCMKNKLGSQTTQLSQTFYSMLRSTRAHLVIWRGFIICQRHKPQQPVERTATYRRFWEGIQI